MSACIASSRPASGSGIIAIDSARLVAADRAANHRIDGAERGVRPRPSGAERGVLVWDKGPDQKSTCAGEQPPTWLPISTYDVRMPSIEIPLTSTAIMQGAWFSLEHCGHLLQDAVLLFRKGHHSTAVGVAMIARDELGKYMELLDLWNHASAGKLVTTKSLTRNHLDRQKLAALSATLMDGDDEERQRRFKALETARDPSERQRLIESLGDAEKRKGDRERAFYVDPVEGGWSRPSAAFSAQQAERIIVDALNDYRVQQDPTTFSERRPGLNEALKAWTEKPELPAPPEPKEAALL